MISRQADYEWRKEDSDQVQALVVDAQLCLRRLAAGSLNLKQMGRVCRERLEAFTALFF